jgi:cysteine desulfurase
MIDASPLYLDHAATSPMRPEAKAAMDAMQEKGFGNASSQHGPARAAKNALEEAREVAAEIIGSDRPHDIVFTGGGTESDNLGVAGVALASDKRQIIVSAIEHKAVMESALGLTRFGYRVTLVGVDSNARVSPEDVASSITDETAVVSVMAANNETGTLEPISQVVAAVKSVDSRIPVHTDAVQAFVSESVDVSSSGVDLMSLSSHKFGGPNGVGLLYVKAGVRVDPIVRGGGQEAGRRAGTSNVAGIVGMVAAMQATDTQRSVFRDRVGTERDSFEAMVTSERTDAAVSGHSVPRTVHHAHIHFPGILAETLLIRLDQAGVATAAGSACQSGAVEPSHVLSAMGFDDTAAGECIRFTFGWPTREGDGLLAARRVLDVIGGIR